MKIQPFGDRALIISFEKKIDEAINQEVIHFYHILKNSGQFTFLTPAYCSLTVGIDRTKFTISEATECIRSLANSDKSIQRVSNRTITIPVCYNESFGIDLAEVAQYTQRSIDQVIKLHTETPFRVFMLGFVAGFAYMGTLPAALECPRKQTPRKSVPKGAVGLAGQQTGIYPVSAPGGWQIIGQTPLNMFDTKKEQPNLLLPGDTVKFRPINMDEFKLISIKVETDIYALEMEEGHD